MLILENFPFSIYTGSNKVNLDWFSALHSPNFLSHSISSLVDCRLVETFYLVKDHGGQFCCFFCPLGSGYQIILQSFASQLNNAFFDCSVTHSLSTDFQQKLISGSLPTGFRSKCFQVFSVTFNCPMTIFHLRQYKHWKLLLLLLSECWLAFRAYVSI